MPKEQEPINGLEETDESAASEENKPLTVYEQYQALRDENGILILPESWGMPTEAQAKAMALGGGGIPPVLGSPKMIGDLPVDRREKIIHHGS